MRKIDAWLIKPEGFGQVPIFETQHPPVEMASMFSVDEVNAVTLASQNDETIQPIVSSESTAAIPSVRHHDYADFVASDRFDTVLEEFIGYVDNEPTGPEKIRKWLASKRRGLQDVTHSMRIRRKPQEPEFEKAIHIEGVEIATSINPIRSIARYARQKIYRRDNSVVNDNVERAGSFSVRKALLGATAVLAVGLMSANILKGEDADNVAATDITTQEAVTTTTSNFSSSVFTAPEITVQIPQAEVLQAVPIEAIDTVTPEAPPEVQLPEVEVVNPVEEDLVENVQITIQNDGGSVYNEVQDALVGEHGARADNDEAVRALTDEVIELIASQNKTTVQNLSNVAIGQTMGVEMSPEIVRIRNEVQNQFQLFSGRQT